MPYDFNKVIDRSDTMSQKWDNQEENFPENPEALPFWVADMDFPCPEPIVRAVQERAAHPDYWLKKIIEQDGNIMVTDVRVPHEYEVFKNAGAVSIRVEASRETRASRGELIGENDITETGLDNIKDWDYVIENNSDYDTLVNEVNKVIKELNF